MRLPHHSLWQVRSRWLHRAFKTLAQSRSPRNIQPPCLSFFFFFFKSRIPSFPHRRGLLLIVKSFSWEMRRVSRRSPLSFHACWCLLHSARSGLPTASSRKPSWAGWANLEVHSASSRGHHSSAFQVKSRTTLTSLIFSRMWVYWGKRLCIADL